MNTKNYFDEVKKILPIIQEKQRDNVLKISKFLGDAMSNDALIHLVSLNEGNTFSMELNFRAGGMMPFSMFNTEDLVLKNKISSTEYKNSCVDDEVRYAKMLWDMNNIEKNDVFFFISYSGVEPLLVELASIAEKKGHKMIIVTNLKTCENTKARHESGKKLTDFGDFLIDYGLEEVDVITDVDGTHYMNQMSSFVGDVIAQMITAEIYRYLKSQGKQAPVLQSANTEGADKHNNALRDKYLGRGRY